MFRNYSQFKLHIPFCSSTVPWASEKYKDTFILRPSSKNVGFSKTSASILPTRKEKTHSLHAGQQLKSNIVASFERFSIFTHKKHPNILRANLNLNINMHLKKTHQLHYLHKLPRNAQDVWTTNPCPIKPNGSKNSSGGHLVPLLTWGGFSMSGPTGEGVGIDTPPCCDGSWCIY